MFSKSSEKGFTLIELSIVLVIIGLVISAGAQLLPMLVKQSRFKQNQIMVNDAKKAIIGYIMATGRPPYAAQTTNGVATAGRINGYLPWATLGISGNDAYMRTLVYAVEGHFYAPAPTTTATIKARIANLINNSPAPNLSCNPGGNLKVAFVVVSSGENRTLNAPNSVTSRLFSDPTAPVISTADDIVAAEPLSILLSELPSTWPGP